MNNIRFLLTDDNEFSYDTEKSYNQIKEELLTTGKFSFDDGYGTVCTYFKNSLIYMEYIDNSMDVKVSDSKKYYYDINFSCDTYESVALLTPFEEFCKLIVENETIELSDEDSHLFFFSKYVTYIEWDSEYDDLAEEDRVEEKDEERKREEHERAVLIPLKREILSYEFSLRMKLWFFWHCRWDSFRFNTDVKEILDDYNEKGLSNILTNCKKYCLK